MAWLPKWFVIDQPTPTGLPAGFVVDQPQVQPKWSMIQWMKEDVAGRWIWQYLKDEAQKTFSPMVWAVAWISKVAESTTGKGMDWLGKKLFGESYWTIWGITEKVVPKILQWQENSFWYKAGEVVWKNLPSFAATAWLWSIWWAFVPRVIKWAGAWAIGTQANTLLTEWRLATPKETAIWAWVWAVLWWSFGGKVQKQKKVLNLIQESDTIWNKRAALPRWWINKQSKLNEFLFWTDKVVKPSQRSIDASKTVVDQIKWVSTKDPQRLYTQIDNKIWEIAQPLSNDLKTIWVKWTNKTTTDVISKLKDLSTEMSDISKITSKKITTLWANIKKATNADEIRNWLKQMDKVVPENIKKWLNLSGKDQVIYDAWRTARSAGNDLLEEIADKTTNIPIKQSLKTMSNLFHAKWQIQQNIGKLTPTKTWALKKIWRLAKNLWGTVIAGKILQKLWVFWWWNNQ
jgi:hypothetical protein